MEVLILAYLYRYASITFHELGHLFFVLAQKKPATAVRIGRGSPALKFRIGRIDFILGPIPKGGAVEHYEYGLRGTKDVFKEVLMLSAGITFEYVLYVLGCYTLLFQEHAKLMAFFPIKGAVLLLKALVNPQTEFASLYQEIFKLLYVLSTIEWNYVLLLVYMLGFILFHLLAYFPFPKWQRAGGDTERILSLVVYKFISPKKLAATYYTIAILLFLRFVLMSATNLETIRLQLSQLIT